MVKKRDINDDERALWIEVVRDVRRSGRTSRTAKAPKRQPSVAVQAPAPAKHSPVVQPVPPKKRSHSGVIPDVDGATAERLRRGKIEPDARLDLHGLTKQQAHSRLLAFVRRGHDVGYRCLLIITGKGAAARSAKDDALRPFIMPDRAKAGVLHSLVPLWLEQPETRNMVVGIQAAHQRHGGGGAYYAYLRRKTARGG